MKRFITLVLALGLAISMFQGTPAKAVDFKVSGSWVFGFGYWQNSSFYDQGDIRSNDNFQARQRFRTQIDVIASEQLRGVVMFEIGTIAWGRDNFTGGGTSTGRGSGGRLDADGVNVETKRAYLDWVIPDTGIAVRMGIQGFALPSATGYQNPVFSGDVAGVTLSYKFNDMFALTAFWFRPFDANLNDGADKSIDDELDLLGFALPVTLDGLKVTPWFMYANIGGGSGYWGYRKVDASDGKGLADNVAAATFDGTQHGWWVGTGIELSMFDPLSFRADIMYGRTNGSASDDAMNAFLGTGTPPGAGTIASPTVYPGTAPGASGWFMDAILEYKLDWGVPGIFGWYSSGDDESDWNAGRLGRMPMIGADNGFGPTTLGMKGGFSAFGFDAAVSRTGIGTWGIGAQIKDMSFVEKLTHTLRFAYYRGTNDTDMIKHTNGNPRVPGLGAPLGTNGGRNAAIFGEALYLTTGDSVFEVNFNHQYKIYDNLTVAAELAWLVFDMDNEWDKQAVASTGKVPGSDTKNSWKAELFLLYTF